MFGVEVKGSELTVKGLEGLMTKNPEAVKRIQGVIGQLLLQARNEVAGDVKTLFPEHESWRAIRRVVYKQLLGGNINILNMVRGTASWKIPPKKQQPPGKRGGNRSARSLETGRRQGYEGKARGFILRFQEQGTPNERKIRFKFNDKRHEDKWNKHPNTGHRGNIAPRNFFEPSAERALGKVAKELGKLIDEELQKMYQEETKE